MPHIIVEYSNALEAEMPTLLPRLHDGLAAQGIDKARIKTRGIAVSHPVVGDQGGDGQMMHATLLLLEGRDIPTKKQYGEALKAELDKFAPPGCAVTLEVRDMVADTYYM